MTWLETLFGISPDGGNGFSEAILVAALVMMLGTVGAALRAVHRRRHYGR